MGMFDQFTNGTYEATPIDPPQQMPRALFTGRPAAAPPAAAPVDDRGESWSPRDPEPAPRPRFPAGTLPPGFKPLGELKPADLSWSDTAKSKVQDALIAAGMSPYSAGHLGRGAVDIASTLTPMGSVLAGADLTYNLPRGNYVASGLDVIGTLPLVGQARRALGWSRAPAGVNPAPSTDELRANAKANYRFVESAPYDFHPGAVQNANAIIRSGLENGRLPGGSVWTPESAPAVYSTLQRFERGFDHTRPVTPQDFDTLRQQLNAIKGQEGPAARSAVQVLDQYMVTPHAFNRGTPQEIADVGAALRNARGDWRSMRTQNTVGQAVEAAQLGAASTFSGMNEGNRIRQAVAAFERSDAGRRRLFGALPDERQGIRDVATGDTTTNFLRNWSNRLGAGGGLGQSVLGLSGGTAAGTTAHMLGVDPVTSVLIGSGIAATPAMVGVGMRRAANERVARSADELRAQIGRNSPTYRADVAARPPPDVDPLWRRANITNAILARSAPTFADRWNSLYAPYENQE